MNRYHTVRLKGWHIAALYVAAITGTLTLAMQVVLLVVL